MKLLDYFKFKPKAKSIQTGMDAVSPFQAWMGYTPLSTPDARLYDAIREAIPIIDAAIDKIVRLTGGFKVRCLDKIYDEQLQDFIENIPVNACSKGLRQFISIYLESMLMYGNAVGEIVLDQDEENIAALYNAKLDNIHLKTGDNPLEVLMYTKGWGKDYQPVPRPELIMITPLNPPAGELKGVSLLRSLPFVSSILIQILQSTKNNFDRIANLRYAVTYNPGSSGIDRANAKDIADSIAVQWQDVMESQEKGVVKDFVAVGDVEIKVIGSDSQMLDTEVPIRQVLEQIVAKLGIPPFMLGLHWSTTERMSSQQSDILTSELESYRYHLEGIITKACETFLRLLGSASKVTIEWEDINLQDKMEEANVRLINAQAIQAEHRTGGEVIEIS